MRILPYEQRVILLGPRDLVSEGFITDSVHGYFHRIMYGDFAAMDFVSVVDAHNLRARTRIDPQWRRNVERPLKPIVHILSGIDRTAVEFKGYDQNEVPIFDGSNLKPINELFGSATSSPEGYARIQGRLENMQFL